MSHRVAAVLLALSLATSAGAQASARPLTLDDAVRLARGRHPAIVAASARRQSGAAQARQEAAFPNPSVEWRREDLGTRQPGDAFVTVLQPLDVTGRRFALRAGAAAIDRRLAADSATVARHVEVDAARAFWRASLAQALAALAIEHREDAERLAASEAARAREGAIAESWAIRASLEAERARLAEGTARAELARARADLARAVALAPDSLPPVVPLALASAGPVALPDTTLAAALAGRSEVASARAAQEAAGHRTSAARRGILTDLALSAGTKRTAGQTMQTFAVAVPFPLLDRGGAARQAAAGERRLAEADARLADATVRADVAGAVQGYQALAAARPAGGPALAAQAEEVARIAEGAYAAGGASLLELLDARRARAETLGALLRWTAELRLAALDVARATGAPIIDSTENP